MFNILKGFMEVTGRFKALPKEELKTSQQWNIKYNYKIIDFDGWNRKDLEWSYYVEKVTEKEFNKRVFSSTVEIKIK